MKTSGSFWQCFWDEPASNNDAGIIDFSYYTESTLLEFKQTIIGQTGNDATKDVEIIDAIKWCWCN